MSGTVDTVKSSLPDIQDPDTIDAIKEKLGVVYDLAKDGIWISDSTEVTIQDLTPDNYAMRMKLRSMKYISGVGVDTSAGLSTDLVEATYTFGLAWVAQVDCKLGLAANQIWQAWFSPKMAKSPEGGYVNYMCQTQYSSSPTLKSTIQITGQPVVQAVKPGAKAAGTWGVGTNVSAPN